MALFKKDPGDVLDVEKAARLLDVSRDDVLGALARDTLPARRVGGEWRIGRDALKSWLESGSPSRYCSEIFLRLTAFNLAYARENELLQT